MLSLYRGQLTELSSTRAEVAQGSRNCMGLVVGGPSEKYCQTSLIFYCKIPILCQSLAKSAQILLVIFDRIEDFRELWTGLLNSTRTFLHFVKQPTSKQSISHLERSLKSRFLCIYINTYPLTKHVTIMLTKVSQV